MATFNSLLQIAHASEHKIGQYFSKFGSIQFSPRNSAFKLYDFKLTNDIGIETWYEVKTLTQFDRYKDILVRYKLNGEFVLFTAHYYIFDLAKHGYYKIPTISLLELINNKKYYRVLEDQGLANNTDVLVFDWNRVKDRFEKLDI